MADWVADRCGEIAHEMGARQVALNKPYVPRSVVPYQTTHNTDGTVMGTDPKNSVLNRYLQCWNVPNVFVMGTRTSRRTRVTTLRARSAR